MIHFTNLKSLEILKWSSATNKELFCAATGSVVHNEINHGYKRTGKHLTFPVPSLFGHIHPLGHGVHCS